MNKNQIIKSIIDGSNEYFGYSHFDVSNMADYQMMSDTINDLTAVYGINEIESADIVSYLTHKEEE